MGVACVDVAISHPTRGRERELLIISAWPVVLRSGGIVAVVSGAVLTIGKPRFLLGPLALGACFMSITLTMFVIVAVIEWW